MQFIGYRKAFFSKDIRKKKKITQEGVIHFDKKIKLYN